MVTTHEPTSAEAELIIFRFTGTYEREDHQVFCVCKEAPLVGCGSSDELAYEDVKAALDIYIESLAQRGELGRAIEEKKLPVLVTLKLDALPGKHLQALQPTAPGDSWLKVAELHRNSSESVRLTEPVLV